MEILPSMYWGDDLDVRFYLLKKLTKLRNKKVLDIGCNVGLTLSFLDESNWLYGIDINKECVEYAKNIVPKAFVSLGTMEKLPYQDNCFDTVLLMSNMPYYNLPISEENKNSMINNTFNEIYRVLKNGGVLHLTTGNAESYYYSPQSKKVRYEELENILTKFDLLKIQGWNCLKPFLPKYFSPKYRFIPPKILCNFEYIWKRLEDSMDNNIRNSKNYYVEAIKK